MFSILGTVLGFSLVWFLCRPSKKRVKSTFKFTQKNNGEPEISIEYEDDRAPRHVVKTTTKKVDSSDMFACVAVFIVAFLLIIWMCMSF